MTEYAINLVKEILSGDEIEVLMDDLLHNPKYFASDLVPLIKRILDDSNISIDISVLLKDLSNLLNAIVEMFLYNPSIIISFISTSNISAVASSHFPELSLAHLQARDPNYNSNPITSDMSGKYYRFSSSDINSSFIVKRNGEVIARLDNGNLVDVNSSCTYGIDHGKFVAYFPYVNNYEIICGSETTSSLEVYEPNKIRFDSILSSITTALSTTQLDGNVKVSFE